MNKYQAEARRNVIRKIILDDKRRHLISVDDWYRDVANSWPTGIQFSPAKGTVRSELFAMADEGLLKSKLIERGHFRQWRFAVKDAEVQS